MVLAVAPPLKASVAPEPADAGVTVPEMASAPAAPGNTSTMLRLYRSVVGDVSLIVTLVPSVGVAALCICIQNVSPLDERSWWIIVWFGPRTLATALSQSFPTPRTRELLRVVVNDAVGAPEPALPVPSAPMAPEPFVPDVSTPAKLMTSMEAVTLCDRFA